MMDVLIVENDPIVTKMWSKKLTAQYEVRIAESVDKAKKEISDKMPSLVLLDLRLNGPSNSGLTVYDFIRKELNNNIPIIFITGLAYNVELFQRAQSMTKVDTSNGIGTYLMEKPVRINDLFDAVCLAEQTHVSVVNE